MAVFKCKMCGGALEINENLSVGACPYCGTQQTFPKVDDEKKLALFNRANNLRFKSEFDKATGIYESIVSEFPDEAEAYWGLVLCKYGIEYVDDPSTGKKVPTCHRTVTTSVLDDEDFELACEYADISAKMLYRDEAKAINDIQKKILEIVATEEPYDVFICYKETDPVTGLRTDDSTIAQDVYTELIQEGYKVFFSRVTLRNKAGTEYEPYIYSALSSAKVMLVFGTKFDYFDAVWVKNEWSRYLLMMSQDNTKHLIPCYKDLDAYDIPKEFRNLQALNINDVTFIKSLFRNIKNFVPKVTEKVVEKVVERPVERPVGEIDRKNGPAIIRNVCSIGTCDYENMWPTGQPRTVFNYDEHYVISFQLGINAPKLRNRKVVKLGTAFYNGQGLKIVDEEIELQWSNSYDRMSKTFYLRGQDGTVVPTGKYRVEFWVDESSIYEYSFVVTSSEEILAQRNQMMRQKQAQMASLRAANRCQHCGGEFKKGMFSMKCAQCGKSKDY